ncbi:DUF1642 domain-containing protein [Streptococcus sp. VTCC 12905]|uniref:DUF1642 domain-containing protein n=1 Tax=Streptococcus sp. VTCC 12905 TaxID=3413768 RepID=UPI003D9C704E
MSITGIWRKQMNKQEAIELLRDVAQRVFYRTGSRAVHIDKIVELVNEIDEPQKVVIPKFVAEWLEYCKSNKLTLLGAFDPVSEHGIGLANTFTGEVWKGIDWAKRNQDTFARAWLDGYTVEQEKLYTVEIPNNGGTLVLACINQAIKLVDGNKHFPGKFTKELIENAGFDWALKWAKPVEENNGE